jgi:hypothetical protein
VIRAPFYVQTRPPYRKQAAFFRQHAQRFSRCGGAAGERKNPRPGAKLRGPRCTGRAWWPVDLVTWAAPAGPVAVVPGAQLFAPRYVHTFAVIRSQVRTYIRSYSRTWWPGPWSLAGDLVAAPGLAGDLVAGAWFVITCAPGVCDPRPGAGGHAPRLTIRALVAVVPGPWPAPWWPGRVPAGVLAIVSTHFDRAPNFGPRRTCRRL